MPLHSTYLNGKTPSPESARGAIDPEKVRERDRENDHGLGQHLDHHLGQHLGQHLDYHSPGLGQDIVQGFDDLPMAEALASVDPDVTLVEVLVALNHLSQVTRRYLGTSIIVNYWRSTCPPVDWLNNFQVDRGAQFSFNRSTPQRLAQPLTEEEHAWVKSWVAAFVTRCSAVIRNYGTLLTDQALNETQKFLLLS
jgi:hypothetical protein